MSSSFDKSVCRSGDRPGVVWFEITCILHHYHVTLDVRIPIHKEVMLHPLERIGHGVALDRIERERRARLERGADPPVPLWRLLGFGDLHHFLMHKREEMRYSLRNNGTQDL